MQPEAPFKPSINRELIDAICETPWPLQLQSQQTPDGKDIFLPVRHEYQLGNRQLPIASRRELIVHSILQNEVTVIDAKTGAGKSSQIAQYAVETGQFGRVIETQPRIIAARTTAERMASEMFTAGLHGGKIVGYQTANEWNATPQNEVTVCTDGLTLMHMLGSGNIGKNDLLLIDEFHERNVHMDFALALAHRLRVRTVIMSATLDTERVAKQASAARGGIEVPILNIPGRMYDIEERSEPGIPMTDAIVRMVREIGQRKEDPGVLVFVPGRREAGATLSRVSSRLPRGIALLTLNGDQTPAEQARVLESYPRGKLVLSTDIGKTSLTVPGIDGVLDSLYERTGNFRSSVRGLPIVVSSAATSEQRKGRAGRVMNGVYETATIEGYPIPARKSDGEIERHAYDQPQIYRTDLSGHVARLRSASIGIEDLDMLDRPEGQEVDDAVARLRQIGAVVARGVELTAVGGEMAGIPIDVHFARMLVESRKYSPAVQLKMMAAVAACQQQNICSTETDKKQWQYLSRENRSDILVQADVFIKSMAMSEDQRAQYNFLELRRNKALVVFERLASDQQLDIRDLKIPTEAERQAMLACIVSGGYELHVKSGSKWYRDRRGHSRELADSTVLESSQRLVLGVPVDISHMRTKGLQTQQIITHSTGVTIDMLQKYAPHRLQYVPRNFSVTPEGKLVISKEVFFDDVSTRMQVKFAVEPSEEAREHIVEALISRKAAGNDETLKGIYASLVELENLQNRTTKNLRLVNAKKLIAARLQQAPLAELTSLGAAAQYINPAEIRGIVSEEARQEILRQAPDNITVATQEGNQPIDVRYIKNEAYLTVPVAHIPGLPSSFPQLGNRTIHVRSTMGGKSMPIDEAREYYARPNRSDRRGNVEREPQSLTGPAGKSLDEGNLAARGFTRFRRHGRTGRDGRS